jgi:hypothetical protein
MESLVMAKVSTPKDEGPGIVTQTRLQRSERAALDKAAADEVRPTASLMRKIIVEWLREQGYLK